MDINQARTFLAITANSTFLSAAKALHITQSTVSTRIRNLEIELGTQLFYRDSFGARLTSAGKRFVPHAKALVLTEEQARHDVGLPSKYKASIRIGARIALWNNFLPQWVGWMRKTAPDVSLNSEIGFEKQLTRRLIEGTLDIAIMYTPNHDPGLVVEHLFDETLVLLNTQEGGPWNEDEYVYVDWGPGFYAWHRNSFPDLEPAPQRVDIGWTGARIILGNGGSCFLPLSMAQPWINSGKLYRTANTPEFTIAAYMVYPQYESNDVLEHVVMGLRQIARSDQA